ncbi:DExH-box splicing factor binding site-domain-containing protein [Stachybotrys elegans]|uniref:Pre-mRNA-splicing factor n=1 Tax=Stachybotrys elegans TaxID=80388 RepID=A0A8K0WP44_9HYPO|nr:DExH-box splicing factor binding site-domain-containing protein [Stachybotrys elegans]
MSEPTKNRIAIKLGGAGGGGGGGASKPSPFSSRPKPISSLGKRPRSNAAAWGGSDDEDDEDDAHNGRHEAITGFGSHGAEVKNKRLKESDTPKQYVIERQSNRDWKSEVRARNNTRQPTRQDAPAAPAGTVETEPADQDKGLKWGLTIKEKKPEAEEVETTPAEQEATAASSTAPLSEEAKETEGPKRTADDDAMDALLGKTPAKDLAVIRPGEEDAFRRDLRNAGEVSTVADYEAMPAEEFGAALLRGMGWDGQVGSNAKAKDVKRRPKLIGLGAKALNGDEDLGGWNQSGKKKSSRPRLDDYNRGEAKRREERRGRDSYKDERDRERDSHRHRDRHGGRDRHRDYDRDRRR